MPQDQIDAAQKLEMEIAEKFAALQKIRQTAEPDEVPDYTFATPDGGTTLAALFGEHDQLLVIHNMGQGCRYCTLWGDGINGIISHLEDAMAVVVASKDSPELQRRFALSRGWQMRMVSHGGGAYMIEQASMGDIQNFPGAAVYEKRGSKIMRRAKTAFGPGDLYSPFWHFLALGGRSNDDWGPEFRYWTPPETLDDGG